MNPIRHLLFQCLLILSLTPPANSGGHEVGNGGDSLAESIRRRALFLTQSWGELPPRCLQSFGPMGFELKEIARRVTILTQSDPLFLEENGKLVQKEAINYPASMTVIFHRQSYLESPSPELLIMHELLGLLSEKDFGFAVSSKVLRWLSVRDCPQPNEPVTYRVPLTQDPLQVWQNKNHDMIFMFANPARLQVYNIKQQQLETAAPLPEDIHHFSYSAESNRAYASSHGGNIYILDLGRPHPAWKRLHSLPTSLESMVATPEGLFVIYGKGSWCNQMSLSLEGKVDWFSDWRDCANEISYDGISGSLFYLHSRSFPINLHRIRLRGAGHAMKDMQSPYHGAFEWKRPVVPGSSLVALGQGMIFDQQTLSLHTSLPKGFDLGLWSQGLLVTAERGLRRFNLIEWSSDFKSPRRNIHRDGELLSLVPDSRKGGSRFGLLYKTIEGEYILTFDIFSEAF